MEVIYNDQKIDIDTELEPGYEEFDFVTVINDYDLEDTLVVKPDEINNNNEVVNGQMGDEDGK
jgi:hypothetical protein